VGVWGRNWTNSIWEGGTILQLIKKKKPGEKRMAKPILQLYTPDGGKSKGVNGGGGKKKNFTVAQEYRNITGENKNGRGACAGGGRWNCISKERGGAASSLGDWYIQGKRMHFQGCMYEKGT